MALNNDLAAVSTAEPRKNKLTKISDLAQENTLSITQSAENWTGFLDSAAKMYKYTFADQVLIHAQRPDATACAAMPLWNNAFNRWVKKGSTGIALIDRSGEEPRLKYVFDVADTRGRENARPPYIWQMNPEHEASVSEMLKIAYNNYAQGNNLKEQITTLAKTLAGDYTFDALVNRKYSKEILESSLAYVVLSRCGLETEGFAGIFAAIKSIDTVEEAGNLGNALGELSREILTQIEHTVKDHERQKARELRERGEEHGRDHVPSGRGLSDTGFGVGRSDGSSNREVREDETAVPGKTPESGHGNPADQGDTNGTPSGHRGDGAKSDRTDDRENAETRPSSRQSDESDGLGAAYEQPESISRRDRDAGADLQLDAPVPEVPLVKDKSLEAAANDSAASVAVRRSSVSSKARKNDNESRQLLLFPTEDEQREYVAEDVGTLPRSVIRERLGIENNGERREIVIGDTVWLNGKLFRLEESRESPNSGLHHRFLDVGTENSWLLVSNVWFNSEELERHLREDPRNAHLSISGNQQERTELPKRKDLQASKQDAKRQIDARELTEEKQSADPMDTTAKETKTKPEAGYDMPSEAQARINAEKINYRITDDDLGIGGQKTKYRNNIAAIHTLHEIEKESRTATLEEQETLSKYVGWGGIPQIFDRENKDWNKEYEELKGLLPEEEYASARASTLNAHYTSPTVIKAMYDTLGRMGFQDGNLLEPAMGVGNFFGLLPESMKGSRLYGVELDGITGRIAKQLYPNAEITVSGYEKTGYPDNFFDLAVGNVPFGAYKVADPKYDRQKLLIHDYFFAKTLDQVRPGGVVAFVTSNGTLDKANPTVRKYLAERAELLGAVRLPNTAFKANAGTEVTTDILFLQKRDRPLAIEPDWVHLGKTEDGVPLNSYFVEHPHMVLGKMAFDASMYGNEKDTTCLPVEGANLAEQLRGALTNIRGQILERIEEPGQKKEERIPADPRARNYSYTVIDGELYYREDSVMVKPKLSADAIERAKALVELRDCTRALIDTQLTEEDDTNVRIRQAELNDLYDHFSEKYGLVNDKANARAFNADSAYYLLCSLEVLDENRNLERKADMFTKRTIRQHGVPLAVETPSEALALSLSETASVNMAYMQSLLPEGMDKGAIIAQLRGVIFPNPEKMDEHGNPMYEAADEYLSGNVRCKLAVAREFADTDPAIYGTNVVALEAAQPKELEAHEIDVRLGATWIGTQYVKQFMFELLETSAFDQRFINVQYSSHSSEWFIENKNRGNGNVRASTTWGTESANAYRIIEDTLNLRDVRVYTLDEHENRVLDKEATAIAQQKQEAIKGAFKEWIFKDPDRRQALVEKYNEIFNSTRPREYDGSHITFVGKSPEIGLRKHQTDAIARILYGGNTLLAHEVGAGKTFEMVGAAMESKRLGLAQKSLFVVPNHLTEQMASEFMALYPAANILVATKRDFETANRKKFCGRIATGDYDAIIIGHSQFEKIPLSAERQERFLHQQVEEITNSIEEMQRASGARFQVKQMEKTKQQLETRLKNLAATDRKDDVVTFEELGVDRVFVDEAHSYKNLFLYTKMRNVAGIPQTEALKSSDLYMKCQYMDELTGNKGVIFATGTPVSNSMTELYTMMRYLQSDTLKEQGLEQFDAWASTYGETTTSIELAPEGTGYRARTRFAKFYNLPELMKTFKEVADIKTADTLDLPRPVAHYKTIAVKPTEHQKELVGILSERAAAVHDRKVEPHEDNMLKITSDGRKIGLDQRLINPHLPDDPDSKVNACMKQVYGIWNDTKEKKLTQLVFCDFSTPDKDKFNVYDDIKAKLIDKGVPEKEIAYIHDADTEVKKKELFAKVRKGQVRVLMGSTQKMGAGTNVQDKLIAIHDLDCPWRPADLEQRAGRIVRQGNQNPEVSVYRYVTESTFDAYLYQTIENKQKFISQVMTSKNPVRSCEDVDESVLSYAEVKALCIGDPRIKEKMDLDIQVSKLRMLEASHRSESYRLEDRVLKHLPHQIARTEERIVGLEKDLKQYVTRRDEKFVMTVSGKIYGEKEKTEAGEEILLHCKTVQGVKSVESIGKYMDFDIKLAFNHTKSTFELSLQNDGLAHRVELGESASGNITRINNTLEGIPERLELDRRSLEEYRKQVEDAKEELKRPFSQEEELKTKTARLAELDILLNMDALKGHRDNVLEAALIKVAERLGGNFAFVAMEDEASIGSISAVEKNPSGIPENTEYHKADEYLKKRGIVPPMEEESRLRDYSKLIEACVHKDANVSEIGSSLFNKKRIMEYDLVNKIATEVIKSELGIPAKYGEISIPKRLSAEQINEAREKAEQIVTFSLRGSEQEPERESTVKNSNNEQIKPLGTSTDETIQVGRKVVFRPHGGKAKLTGEILSVGENTIDLRVGGKVIPVYKAKGTFEAQNPVKTKSRGNDGYDR